MIYAFENAQGDTVDMYFPAGQAPKIGEVIVVDGEPLRRVAHFHLDTGGIARKTHQYPFVSQSLPKGCSPDSEVKSGPGKGKPIIKSQAHEREVLAKTGYVRD